MKLLLHFVLYGCRTLSHILREEYRFKVFQKCLGAYIALRGSDKRTEKTA
jgi:hypothetical protein